MNDAQAAAEKADSLNPRSEANTQLHGYKLVLARTVWVIIAVVAVALYILDIPPGYAQYLTTCTRSICSDQQATPEMTQALHSVGLSLQFYAIYLTTLSIITMLICIGTAAIIAWRKSRDWMGLLVALALILFGTVPSTDYQQLATAFPFVQIAGDILQFLLSTFPFVVGFLFPNGRFVPRWTRWFALLIILCMGFGAIFPTSLFNTNNWPGIAAIVLQVMIIASILFAQIYRYLRVSTPSERQQTKWVVLGITVFIIYFILLTTLGTLYPALTEANGFGILLAEATYDLALLIVPVALGFSILRYRLWEIDLLINRTLVYVTLTAILALIYFACVIFLQNLVNRLTEQAGQSPIIIVGSTLAIAALFQPLRRRIQEIIDRRFYRRKYNAARTLAAFNATLRNEVDLNELREHLLAVVQETMQPTHVSLWLRPTEPNRKEDKLE